MQTGYSLNKGGQTRNNTSIQALLLQVPPADLTGPYPALAYLKSFAEQKGFRVKVQDLSIEALYFLSQPDTIAGLLEKSHTLLKQYERIPVLNPVEQYHYDTLSRIRNLSVKPEDAFSAMNFFKCPEGFFDYSQYKKNRDRLDAFFSLLSAVAFPTTITPSEYPTASMFKSMDQILSHCNPAVNPYAGFYKTILFPQIEACAPSVIGISMVFASQSIQALALGRLIKERFPKIHVTLGGAYISQWVMQMEQAQMDRIYDCTDSVICGEGEHPFTDLLERIVSNQSFAGLKSIIHPEIPVAVFKSTGELSYTDVTTQPPPDFSDLDLSRYLIPKPVIPYSISRGCYWGRCVYCQNRYGDHKMRRYQRVPVEKAVKEITQLTEQYQTDQVNFSNDVIDPAYLKQFCHALLDQGKRFYWNTDLRAEKVFDKKFCRLMARAGLNSVAIGFESACQKILDSMDKGNEVDTTRKVLKNLYDAGVATQAMGFFGFPGEHRKEGEMTVRFLEENVDRISYYVIGLLMVMPGSKIHDNPEQYGVTSIRYDKSPLRTPEPVWLSNDRISVNSVDYLYQRLNRLEERYVINENPYTGSLSTNHSFLYFEKGPDILKRIRKNQVL